MDTIPFAFIAAAIAMILGQSWKVLSPMLHGKMPNPAAFLQSGGMPSSHTAATAAMALTCGFRDGFGSTTFAVASVLTAVVAHDAVKVRGSINTIIRIMKATVPEEVLRKEGSLPDTVGHTVLEVAFGFLLAGAVAAGCHFLLPAA